MNNIRKQILPAEEIRNRATGLINNLQSCHLCPRKCGVNRMQDETGNCGIGHEILISSVMPHHGEEHCLSGICGSGTIFFAGCNLDCIFCQNYDLSHLKEGKELSRLELAQAMIYLQELGCHNLNLVTPTHAIPQILESLAIAFEDGFTLPIVYNSGGYDSIDTLAELEGIVDIYMPDFKYWDSETSENLSGAGNYPEIARLAIKEMHRQVGDLVLNDEGLAIRGLLVRHLVLPNGLAGTEGIMRFLAEEISVKTYVNVMGQYRPHYHAHKNPALNRSLQYSELIQARHFAQKAGLYRFAG